MTLTAAAILGVVEGLTEFLPVSSTGHLILAARLLSLEFTPFVTSFEVAIQLGAVLAVLARYLRLLLASPRLVGALAVAFIPTAVTGLVLYPFIKHYLLGNTAVVLWALMAGGIGLIVFERWYPRVRTQAPIAEVAAVTFRQAFIIGCCQALAVVPGVSRAAATAVGGMALGLSRRTAVEFSFLLALPTMLAATTLDLASTAFTFSASELSLLAVGFTTSFLVAWVAVRWLLRYVERHTFEPFGWYRIALAAAGWLLLTRASW